MSSLSKLMDTPPSCFQFKASFSHCIVFELLRPNLDGIKNDLTKMMRHSAQFFQGLSVVIDLHKLNSLDLINFVSIKAILLDHTIVAIGIRGGTPVQQEAAAAAGLPVIRMGKDIRNESLTPTPALAPELTKIISHPIRSGIQVRAESGDLIVTGQISPGAELMANGHIHVYGTLRGRVLAGINGNENARIFCQVLDAELVAIAGYYLTRDEMILSNKSHHPIQIYLKNGQIKIETL